MSNFVNQHSSRRGMNPSAVRSQHGDQDPSLHNALDEVMQSGHRLLVDRIDLIQLEVKEGIQGVAEKAVLGGIAGFLAFGGVILLTVALTLLLSVYMPAYLAVFSVAGLYLLGSGGCVFAIMQQRKAELLRAASRGRPEGSAWTTSQ